jgi:hypothetical protein
MGSLRKSIVLAALFVVSYPSSQLVAQPAQTTVTASNGVQLVKMVDQAKGISAYSIAGLVIDSGMTYQIAPDKTDILLILAKAQGQYQITVEGRFASHFKIEISDYPKQVDFTTLENGQSLMARYDYRMESGSTLDFNHTRFKILLDPAKIDMLSKDKDISIFLKPSTAGDPEPWIIKVKRKDYDAMLEYRTKD